MIYVPIVLVALFLLVGLGLRLFENRLIYFPRTLREGALEELVGTPSPGVSFTEVAFTTEDGETLVAWYGLPEKPRAYVVWFHGNAGSIEHRFGDFSALVRREGLAVLLVDYRGYGRSTGSPDEAGLYLDGRAAADWLLSSGADPDRVFYLGRSLGGAVAVELATERPPRGLILESTFVSLEEMVKRAIPIYPAHWFAKSRFPTLERIGGLGVPILLLHGRRDELIPFSDGERLAEASGAEFVPVDGAGHNDVSEVMGAAYFERVSAFIDRCVR